MEEGKSDHGTFWYALGDNATTPPAENSDETPDENRWSTSVPVGTEVGTYYVWWQLKGYPPNYKDIEPTVIVANIELEEISFTVTFRVANGSWNDGTAADKTVTLTGYKHLLQLYLTESLIPAVGNRPNEGYQAGDWTTQEPTHELPIDEDMTFIYEYQPKTAREGDRKRAAPDVQAVVGRRNRPYAHRWCGVCKPAAAGRRGL